MKTTTTEKPRGDVLRQQHDNLKKMLGRAQEIVRRDHANPVEVWNCFNDLVKAMKVHFQTEEDPGGLFDRLVADAPQFAHRTSQLRQEHDTLRQMALKLAHATNRLTSAKKQIPPEFAEAFAGFSTAFYRHEMKEEELLEDVYSGDGSAID